MLLIANLAYLVYSASQQCVYCKKCALFDPENLRFQELRKHVTETLRQHEGISKNMQVRFTAVIGENKHTRFWLDLQKRVTIISVCQISSFQPLLRRALLQPTITQRPPPRGVTRLDGARARSKFGAPMFESEVFRKQMYCIEESTCDTVGAFRRPPR